MTMGVNTTDTHVVESPVRRFRSSGAHTLAGEAPRRSGGTIPGTPRDLATVSLARTSFLQKLGVAQLDWLGVVVVVD